MIHKTIDYVADVRKIQYRLLKLDGVVLVIQKLKPLGPKPIQISREPCEREVFVRVEITCLDISESILVSIVEKRIYESSNLITYKENGTNPLLF